MESTIAAFCPIIALFSRFFLFLLFTSEIQDPVFDRDVYVVGVNAGHLCPDHKGIIGFLQIDARNKGCFFFQPSLWHTEHLSHSRSYVSQRIQKAIIPTRSFLISESWSEPHKHHLLFRS